MKYIKILSFTFLILIVSCNESKVKDYEFSLYQEDSLKFNQNYWKNEFDFHEESDRHYMLKDIIQNKLSNLDSNETKSILGNPERDFNFSYRLGIYRSPFDPTFLIIEFKENGELDTCKIKTI